MSIKTRINKIEKELEKEKVIIRKKFWFPKSKEITRKILGIDRNYCLYRDCQEQSYLGYMYCKKHLEVMVNRELRGGKEKDK